MAQKVVENNRIRVIALQAIAECVYQRRMEEMSKGRKQQADKRDFKQGDEIEVWTSQTLKALPSWARRATVLDITPGGTIQYKWQGSVRDAAPHLCRPAVGSAGFFTVEGSSMAETDEYQELCKLVEGTRPNTARVYGSMWNPVTQECKFSDDHHRDQRPWELAYRLGLDLLDLPYVDGVMAVHGRRKVPPVAHATKAFVIAWTLGFGNDPVIQQVSPRSVFDLASVNLPMSENSTMRALLIYTFAPQKRELGIEDDEEELCRATQLKRQQRPTSAPIMHPTESPARTPLRPSPTSPAPRRPWRSMSRTARVTSVSTGSNTTRKTVRDASTSLPLERASGRPSVIYPRSRDVGSQSTRESLRERTSTSVGPERPPQSRHPNRLGFQPDLERDHDDRQEPSPESDPRPWRVPSRSNDLRSVSQSIYGPNRRPTSVARLSDRDSRRVLSLPPRAAPSTSREVPPVNDPHGSSSDNEQMTDVMVSDSSSDDPDLFASTSYSEFLERQSRRPRKKKRSRVWNTEGYFWWPLSMVHSLFLK